MNNAFDISSQSLQTNTAIFTEGRPFAVICLYQFINNLPSDVI
jgi:hypothetical protein